MSDSHKPFAKRSFGQNFLVDNTYVRKIVDALHVEDNEHIIEIGPGRGALTELLLSRGARVTAIELDRDMVALLTAKFAGLKKFRLISADALSVDFGDLTGGRPAKLVANLPYYISTPILRRLIEVRACFSSLVLMFQREVVDRIAAGPGSKDRGFLSVLAEATMDIDRLFDVPPSAFRPVPKVWSSVVRFVPKPSEALVYADLERIVSVGFAQKRKTILNNLKSSISDAVGALSAAGISPSARAESLTLSDWTRLTEAIRKASK